MPKDPREAGSAAPSVEAAAERMRELGAVFHSISEGLVFVTPEGYVADMNPAALRMHGFASVQEARRPLAELAEVFEVRDLEGRRLAASERPGARAIRGESFADMELRVRRASDSEEWIGSFSGGPVFSGSGKVALGVVTIRDITARARSEAERRRVEEALRVSEERFRTAVRASPLTVFQQDRELRYTWIENPVATPGTGADLLGRTDADVFENPDDARALEELKRRAIREGRSQRSQVTLHIDGRRCLYDLTVEPLRDAGGEVVGITGAAVDITRHVELEERLRQQTRRLAEADRRKDEFLAMLAHELRSPLAPIRNAAEVLRLRREGRDPPEPEVETIRRQVNQLARLVDDLLDVARITRGLVEMRRERTTLDHVVGLAVETTGPDLAARESDLAVHLPDEAVPLEGDPVRLAQVVANLLSNAAKYSDSGTRVELRAEREDDRVAIRVRDQGVGMSRELLDQVFDLFFQVESSLDRARGGLGLGLTLVKSLVEMHGGTVSAASEGAGRGSEFTVRLPVAPGFPEVEQTTASEAGDRGPDRRVLVVDDSVDTAESFAELLRLSGHEVTVAHDGAGALEAAERLLPEVVFLDIGLPGMDGFEVARRLRRLPGGGEPLLVAITGYGQEESRRRSRAAGFDHHLLKPVSIDHVRRILATAPRGSQD